MSGDNTVHDLIERIAEIEQERDTYKAAMVQIAEGHKSPRRLALDTLMPWTVVHQKFSSSEVTNKDG